MATKNDNHDPLRNPQVDYDRSDLSPKGILFFLIGLFIVGVFIELVIWGMFRFLSHSTLFAQGNPSPLVQMQKTVAEKQPGATLQNTLPVNTAVFPTPRLQTDDVTDMSTFLQREHEILYPQQPFEDSTGAVHIPIKQAMALIVERGLPVKPSTPPRDFNATMSGGAAVNAQSQGMTKAEKPVHPAPQQ